MSEDEEVPDLTVSNDEDEPLKLADFGKMSVRLNTHADGEHRTPLCPICEEPLRLVSRNGQFAVTDTICGCDELQPFKIEEVEEDE